jgi:ribosome-binding protein aMBF1 (putative translation factor)
VICEVCGKKTRAKLTIVMSPELSINTCGECLSDYANHKYGKLTEKVEKHAKEIEEEELRKTKEKMPEGKS